MKLLITLKIFFVALLFLSTNSYAQNHSEEKTQLDFKTKNWLAILVKGDQIYINGKSVNKFREDLVIYSSLYNKIIEDSLTTFLFIAEHGDVSKNTMEVFKLRRLRQ